MKTVVAVALACALPAWAGGSIAGTVAFKGTAPKPAKIERTDAACAGSVDDPSFIASKDGKALANVQVRVLEAQAPAVAPTTPVNVDQKGCMYEPHVQGAVEGQKIAVKNSDMTMHNVHAWGRGEGKDKTLFNVAQPPGPRIVEKDPKASDVVKLRCDVHPWMTAYVVYSKNPYFATTDSNGKFDIKDVPAGEYTVEAWHELFGTVTAKVKVVDGKSVDPKLDLAAK
jgi:plastocyanin